MNSEELEKSLRTEFETYLKDVLAEMKQEVSDFQEKMDSEFEKHKTQLNELSHNFSESIGKEREMDESFRETVTEHLKLARDEGATITASAFEEAEELREESEALVNFSDIRDSIIEITGKETQSDILKSLVHHSTQHTPRGAFFIVKNEHLVGWRIFGMEEHPNPEIIREVYFPISSETTLGESIETLATISSSCGTHEEDSNYLEKMGFGEPENMHAIPLVVRGRGVAVLYADNGSGDHGAVNIEAIETLMRVAGLTVDVLASAPAKSRASETEVRDDLDSDNGEVEEGYSTVPFEKGPGESDDYTSDKNDFEPEEADTQTEYDDTSWNRSVETPSQDFSGDTSFERADQSYTSVQTDVQEEQGSETAFGQEEPVTAADPSAEYPATEFDQNVEEVSTVEFVEAPEVESSEFDVEQESTDFETSQFDTGVATETHDFQDLEETPIGSFDPEIVETEHSFEPSEEVETQAEEAVLTPPARSRFGDRNVDLPIEVTEDERRYHNDARRFARLLVSEIKLYNEQKVKEGRESGDLYERLREAIDRSREMYDKRVQPPVSSKFDYFNYELVNTLAEGEEVRLGGSYPGATI